VISKSYHSRKKVEWSSFIDKQYDCCNCCCLKSGWLR